MTPPAGLPPKVRKCSKRVTGLLASARRHQLAEPAEGAGQDPHDAGSQMHSFKGVAVDKLGSSCTEGLANEKGDCAARGGQVGHAQQLQVQRQERQRVPWNAACAASTRASVWNSQAWIDEMQLLQMRFMLAACQAASVPTTPWLAII
jgi:hypothetical protein